MSETDLNIFSRCSDLLDTYKQSISDFQQGLDAIKNSLKELPAIKDNKFNVYCTQRGAIRTADPWFLWAWITKNIKKNKFKGISVALYFVSNNTGQQKGCTPGVYLALQYGTHGIDPLFSRDAVEVEYITEEIRIKSESMKNSALEKLKAAEKSSAAIALLFKTSIWFYNESSCEEILLNWRKNFTDKRSEKYLDPAQYTFGIIGLIQYKADKLKITSNQILVNQLSMLITAMKVLDSDRL